MQYYLLTPNCPQGGSFTGTGTSTVPNNTVGTGPFYVALEVRDDGNVGVKTILAIGGLSIQISPGLAIRLLVGGATTNWTIPADIAAAIAQKHVVLLVQKDGRMASEWRVYLAGQRLLYNGTGSTDVDVSAVSPLTGGSSVGFKSNFAGSIRNVYVNYGMTDQYGQAVLIPETVVAGWSMLNSGGLFGQNLTITSGGFGPACPTTQPRIVDRLPWLPGVPVVVPAPFDIIGTTIEGYDCCDPFPIQAETRAYNYGQIQFRLKNNNGWVRLIKACSTGYAEPMQQINYTTPAALVAAINAYDPGHWVCEYNATTRVYTLRHLGGSAPDLSPQACGGCNVPHIPYIYNVLNQDIELPFSPAYPTTLVCGECDNPYTCYLQFAVYGLCYELVTPYACFSDRVLSLSFPQTAPSSFYVGSPGYLFPFFFNRGQPGAVLSIRFNNNNQIPRYINISGTLSERNYKSKSEVSQSAFGLTRKIFSQTFRSWLLRTDYYTYNFLDLLNEAFCSDNFAIFVNGNWVSMVLDGDLKLSHEPANLPKKAQIQVEIMESKFSITNNF